MDDTQKLDDAPSRNREVDAQVEGLAQQIVDVVNAADPEQQHFLRDYAVEILKAGTESIDLAPTRTKRSSGADGNPLGIALLIGGFSIPMLLLFPPVGLTLAAIAVLLGVWGLVAMALGR